MASSGSSEPKTAGSRPQASQTDDANANNETGETGSGTTPPPGGGNGPKGADPMQSALAGLSHLVGDGGAANQVTDAITQAVLLLLGTGPAMAAYQGLLSAQQANGEMFNQAVANQQRLNLLGMCTTAKCVRYMFDGNDDDITDVETMLSDSAKG